MIKIEIPKVSIVITTYNEEKDVGRLLNSIIKINYPKNKLETIVVDDGSTDKTSEIVEKFPVKFIMGPHEGMGNARNLGWKGSNGDLVVFIDSDMILHKNYIKEIVNKFLENENVAGVEGNEKLYNKNKFIAQMLHLRHELGWSQSKQRIPRAIKKNVLKKLNGVDPEYGYYIDWELFHRMHKSGYKIQYAPKAILWHKQIEEVKELVGQSRWMGRSLVFSLRKHKFEGIKRIGFVFLLAFFPIYILFLFLNKPFNMVGLLGILTFFIVEFKRTIKMFFITKNIKSFITPFFDVISMTFVVYGIIDKIINLNIKNKTGRI